MDIDKLLFWLGVVGLAFVYLFIGAFVGSIKWSLGNYVERNPEGWKRKLRKLFTRFLFPISVFEGDFNNEGGFYRVNHSPSRFHFDEKEDYLNIVMFFWPISMSFSVILFCCTVVLESVVLPLWKLFAMLLALIQMIGEQVGKGDDKQC